MEQAVDAPRTDLFSAYSLLRGAAEVVNRRTTADLPKWASKSVIMRRSDRIPLLGVNTRTPPTMTVTSGEEATVEIRGAFDDLEDISAVPTPFTPACDGHSLASIAGPILVCNAKSGDGRRYSTVVH